MKELDVAMVIARDEQGHYLGLEKNLELKSKKRYEENPQETAGGKIDDGETAPDAAVRELGEETKLTGIYVGPEEYPDEEWHFKHDQEREDEEDERIHFYPVPVRVPGVKPQPTLSEEHSDHNWYSEQEFEEELPEHNYEGLETVREEFE